MNKINECQNRDSKQKISNIKIATININGLSKKLDQMENCINQNHVDNIFVQETQKINKNKE